MSETMILSKETRDYVKENTVLKTDNMELLVLRVHTSNWGKTITYTITEHNTKNYMCMKGRTVYCRPLSELYGFEIVQ